MANGELELMITERTAELRKANEQMQIELGELKHVEQALRESENQFRTLAETASDAIITIDEQDRIVFLNRAAERVFGYSQPEMLDEELTMLMPEYLRHLHRAGFTSYKEEGRRHISWEAMELRGLHKNGSEIPLELSFGEFTQGDKRFVTGIARDITERKLAEEALRTSERLYRSLARNFPNGGVALFDRDLRYMIADGSQLARVGLSKEALEGKTIWEVFSPEVSKTLEPIYRRALAGTSTVEEVSIGDGVYLRHAVPIHDEHGEIFAGMVLSQDITENRKAAEALRRSEERYRLIVENQTEFIVKWLPDGTRTFVNDSYCRYFGINEEDCLGTSFFPLVAPEFRDVIHQETASLTPEAPAYTEEHLSIVSGGQHWQQWTNRGIFDADGNLTELLSTGQDITERKTAEEALQNSEARGRRLNERFSLAVESAGIGVWDLDLVSNELTWDQQMYRLYQVDPGEFSGAYEAWAKRVHPDDQRSVDDDVQQAIKGVKPFGTDFRVAWPNGEVRHIKAFARVVRDERGVPVRMIGINYDITDRRRAEESLRQSEAHYRALVENTPDIIARFDRDCRYRFVNSAVAQVSEVKPEDFVGRSLREVGFSDEQASFREKMIRNVFETRTPFETEFEFERANGPAIFEWRVYPEFDERGNVQTVLSINRDVTTRKQAEEQLRQSREQLRALSSHLQSVREEERTHIAREVHDELGQALTALKIDLHGLQHALTRKAGSEIDRLTAKIKSMSNLIDTTIHSVRRIATELRPGILDDLGLVAAIEWQAGDFQIRTGIRCEVASSVDYVALGRDRSTAAFRILQETLTNVARHAGASRVAIELKQDDGNLVLEVTDNGKGITEHDIAGSGSLGLLGMRERAHLLGGELEIGGTADEGTAVIVRIPLS